MAWYVAFGLYGHSKMSFWKNCCLFTFYDFLLIFNNSSILIRRATKMCLFINSGQYLWTKWWNSANKKWRVWLCLSHRSKKVHNIPKLSSLSKAEKKTEKKWPRMLLFDWNFMWKTVFWKFPICLHSWAVCWFLAFH